MAVVTTTITMNNRSHIYLMNLVSPALPVGAYAYSQGQEYAVEKGWITDQATAESWISGLLENSIARLDLPLLIRLYRAWESESYDSVDDWNRYLIAARESAEFELEDRQMGQSLMRLLQAHGVPQAVDWGRKRPASFATAFALAGFHWEIDSSSLLQGYAWSWLENQVAAATKLVPLGQTQAQKLLLDLIPSLERACTLAATLEDHQLSSGLPGLALASAQHETQYSRLFRS